MNPTNPKYEERQCDICDDEKLCGLRPRGIWACNDCWRKEQESIQSLESSRPNSVSPDSVPSMKPGTISQISVNEILQQSSSQDTRIQVRADLFNAATKSIVELKQAIDSDDSIQNKPYKLAETLRERFDHFRSVVFELNEKLVQAGNEQRAIQVYLNQLANQLRQEERDKLKIQDINYKPAPPKQVKPATVKSTTKKVKIDKVALRKAAASLGVSEFMLQTIIVSRNYTIEQAVETLKKSIETAKTNQA